MVIYYFFYVKRNVRVSLNVSPNGGRDTSGDDCVNCKPVQRKWDEPNVFHSTLLLRPFVLLTLFDHHVISTDETPPPAQNSGFNLATRGGNVATFPKDAQPSLAMWTRSSSFPCAACILRRTSAAVLSYIVGTRKLMPRAPTCLLCSYEPEPRRHKLKRSARRSLRNVDNVSVPPTPLAEAHKVMPQCCDTHKRSLLVVNCVGSFDGASWCRPKAYCVRYAKRCPTP